jgi:hypothetical protein
MAFARSHPQQGRTLELEAWLREEATGLGGPVIAVFIGESRVGRLPPLAQDRFRQDYDAARSRVEYPVVQARLSEGDGGLFLEVSAPR